MGTKWKDDRKGYKYLLVPDLFNRFVYWMIEYGLFTPGIFRSTSVNTSLVSQIQESIENSFDYTIPPTATPIEIASLLSLYLRELPFPIIDLKTIDPLERNLLPFPLFPLFLPPLLFFFPLLHSFSVSHSPPFRSIPFRPSSIHFPPICSSNIPLLLPSLPFPYSLLGSFFPSLWFRNIPTAVQPFTITTSLLSYQEEATSSYRKNIFQSLLPPLFLLPLSSLPIASSLLFPLLPLLSSHCFLSPSLF